MLPKASSAEAVPIERVVKVHFIAVLVLGVDLGVPVSTSRSGHLAGRLFALKMFIGSPDGVGFNLVLPDSAFGQVSSPFLNSASSPVH